MDNRRVAGVIGNRLWLGVEKCLRELPRNCVAVAACEFFEVLVVKVNGGCMVIFAGAAHRAGPNGMLNLPRQIS